jgi:hypothetical protein
VCVRSWSGAPPGKWASGLCPHEPNGRILYYLPGQEIVGKVNLHFTVEDKLIVRMI